MIDVIVVGAGIVGSTVSEALRRRGAEVLLLDDARPGAGTPPSGGHLKPGWFGDLPKAEYEPALKLLDEVWGLHDEEFEVRLPLVGKVTTTRLYRVDTDQVVRAPRAAAHVTDLSLLNNYPRVEYVPAGGTEACSERCRLLVVATGCWAAELVPGLVIKAKQGVSFRLAGTVARGFIKPWSPYRQIVVHQQVEGELWAGDGTAVLASNWTSSRTDDCLDRCLSATGLAGPPLRVVHGLRPYVDHPKEHPCLLQRLGPRAWLATGAGKSGTIAAGWAAWRILNEHRE